MSLQGSHSAARWGCGMRAMMHAGHSPTYLNGLLMALS
eukprot:CAMPEP_0119417314 /NCGR_PEP_ID=MMETSP1335-20130426/15477_1 /TAXON_ID=259385 /ORGANISM="Chrysoculter rhomboideus, Strain RCC1486" /LENGTH=37 /DNA_ID= /DNA_START= /DNA_END= /DNA_ORIENTATION=